MADRKYLDKYTEEWVMSRRNLNHGLSPLKNVLQSCGNPQDKIRCIHIAGTNGKGSTTNYLKDILVSQGYKVGMFTSPHLMTHRDRIRINDTWIAESVFHQYLLKYCDVIEENQLGMFEIDTLIAYNWFYDEKVDYALIETGLGGRLDNTNVIACPALCVITSIGFDHMQILGTRMQQIAFEKAGIMMHGSKCIVGHIPCSARQVIQRFAFRKHAMIIPLSDYYKTGKQTFRFGGDIYQIATKAQYQMHNASLALLAAEILGVNIHSDIVKRAVKDSKWLARYETVCESPRVIIDGAHNEEGIRALCASVKNEPKPIICVYSALKDKEVHKMGQYLKQACQTLIVTQFENERAGCAEDLYVDGALIEKSYVSAIQRAMKLCQNGTVVITGSLYFISEVRKLFSESDIFVKK